MKKPRASSTNIHTTLVTAVRKSALPDSALSAVKNWLAELLVAQEYAKLGQGGHTQNQVPLRRVFVDLPVAESPNTEPFYGTRALFLEQMLSSPPLRLRHACSIDISSQKNDTVIEDDDELHEEELNEIFASKFNFSSTLLIGGPGQGKSTIGQLACQLHRAALLKPLSDDLTASQREIISTFETAVGKAARKSPLTLPLNPLLPLQISLPDFAAWMNLTAAPSKPNSAPILLRFLADLPSAKNCGLTAEMLLTLASHMPSLIVLDGFDEVGAKKDRQKLATAARDLINILAERDAQAQVIATTRPQGYAGELAQIGISLKERYLTPLTKLEALEYAQKLVAAKISGVDQQKEMIARLKEAAAESATERLLTTPLQVTILTALVQQLGRAPRERWNLFSRYFSYTYDREIERNTYASKLLSDHRSHIEQIHARVALLLQVEAESAGGASARMPRVRLEGIIDAVLSEEEFSEENKKELVRDIAIAAEQRLVFLVEPEPGKFGFEIRSLQEFMAASALSSGRDSDIEARLQQIAKSSMFRNVILFVISRLFSEGSPLRDVLANRICKFLDDDSNDQASHLTHAGSLLALEALEEGAVLSQPKRARALMQRALTLLALPPGNEHVRLGRVANADTFQILKDAIEHGVSNTSREPLYNTEAAWICLISACNHQNDWAFEIGDKYWPTLNEPTSIIKICNRMSIPLGTWLTYRIQDAASKIKPQILRNLRGNYIQINSSLNWTMFLISVFNGERLWERRASTSAYISTVAPIDVEKVDFEKMGPPPAAWQAWIAIAMFEVIPNAKTLAEALLSAAAHLPKSEWNSLEWGFSWPLKVCLSKADKPDDLREFASLATEGKLGDIKEWLAVQKSWRGKVNLLSILSSIEDSIPWKIQNTAVPPFEAIPFWAFDQERSVKRNTALIVKANEVFENSTKQSIKKQLAELCLHLSRGTNTKISKENINPALWIETASSEFIGMLIPKPEWLTQEQWLHYFTNASTNSVVPYFTPEEALQAIIDSGGNPVIFRFSVLCFEAQWRHSAFDPITWKKLSKAISKFVSASADAAIDFSILQIYLGDFSADQDRDLVERISATSINTPSRWRNVLNALGTGKLPAPRTESLLFEIYRVIGNSHESSHIVISLLRNSLQSRVSGLDNRTIWNKLSLPLPLPNDESITEGKNLFPTVPVFIESIELKNVCGIHQIKLPLSTPSNTLGQWTVILGPNGIGKTTILKSLALGLRDVKDPSIWPKGVYLNAWQRVAADIDSPVHDTEIKVKFVNGLEHGTVIRSDTTLVVTQSPEFQRPSLFPLFAYGCRRGSALGGAAREVDLNNIDGPEIATLFDDQADLIHAETWLIQLEGDASKNSQSEYIYKAVIDALKRLLSVSSVWVEDRKLWVTQNHRPRLHFSALSDGYLTSAGWFLDLLARWLEMAVTNEVPITPNFMQEMRGLVLLDEIDLHLHPQWQIEIIAKTRELLPQMSFVVTTHNPLTLVGAKAEEIWVLSSENNKVKATCGIESPILLTSGQIYRRYFGIEDIYPNGLGNTLQRYGFLCGYPMRDEFEEAELIKLGEELSIAGIKPDWEIVPSGRTLISNPPKKSQRNMGEK